MKEKLHFEVEIEAPRALVWDTMLNDETYRDWSSAFGEGGHYEGSWEKDQRIRFLGSDGSGGMVSEIAENRPHEYVSIRHLGIVHEGLEDTTSDAARAWAPAYENYTFSDAGTGFTKVEVDTETPPDYADAFREMWPKGLARLKEIAEHAAVGG
jgi:hypothetical protein